MVNPGCTPLAVKGTTALDPCELVKVTLPVTVSAVFGLNVKLIAAVFPRCQSYRRCNSACGDIRRIHTDLGNGHIRISAIRYRNALGARPSGADASKT